MKIKDVLRYGLAWTACVGILLPSTVLGAPPANQPYQTRSPVRDVALHAGGVLHGKVIDTQGQAVANAPVRIRHEGVQVAHVTTDEQGQFAAPNMQGGVYDVETPAHNGTYRVWSPEAAPPIANQNIEVVEGQVMRGQFFGGHPPAHGQQGGCWSWLKNPWLIGAGIAAAIAIPLALDDDDDDAS